jgi:hypothetical protein
MVFIENNQRIEELASMNDKKKIQLYLDRYVPFNQSFRDMDGRDVDKALWTFGKFLKTSPLSPARNILN